MRKEKKTYRIKISKVDSSNLMMIKSNSRNSKRRADKSLLLK